MQSFLQLFSKYYIWIPNFFSILFCLLFYAVVLTNHIHKPVSKNTIVEKTHFSQNQWFKTFCELASLRSARGSAPSFVSLFSLQTPSINKHILLIKNIFILVNTSNKNCFKKPNRRERNIFSAKTLFWKLFVYTASLRSASRPLRGRPGAEPRHLSRCFLYKSLL